jgi:type I restriction enzyme, S subunit
MPAEWQARRLGDLCSMITDGKHGDCRDESGSGYYFLSVKDVFGDRMVYDNAREITEPDFAETHRRTDLTPGDILFTNTGTIGRMAIAPDDPKTARTTFQKSVAILKPKRNIILPRFLYYVLRFDNARLSDFAAGTTQKNLLLKDLRSFTVRIPPLREQRAIAAVLGAVDDKIELNRRMNATLEAMARALFQSWFVDLDPVRAKLDGRQPAGLDPATAALFPAHFDHAEDGLLPLGWRRAAIDEVCDINARTLGKNDELETLEYVEISEVSRGDIANIAIYPRGEEPSRARRRLRHGDTVLFTVRPDRGSYFLALNPPENRVASTGFAVLTPTKVPWSFIHAAMTQPEVSDHLGQMADGGAYPAVRPEVIAAVQLALPYESKIPEAFHHTCAPLFERAEANRTQSRTLATLRDTLLPKLLSGEVRVNRDGLRV